MENKSKFITYNCKNIKRSAGCVRELCKSADVVALQETWLLPQDIPFLGEIDPDFGYTGKSGMDLTAGIIRGRLYGGVALLWRRSVFRLVSVLKCNSERIVAIKAEISDKRSILIACVYMPTDKPENLPIFTQCLAELNAIIQDNNVESVFMLGDYNAHPSAPFYADLLNFCVERQWLCADMIKLAGSPDAHTFISDAHGCKRWLDHCLVSKAAWNTILNVEILYDVYWSDHLPLQVECNLGLIRHKINVSSDRPNNVMWGIRSSEEIENYRLMCNDQLKHVDFPTQFRECADKMCNNLDHRNVINNLYQSIVSAMRQAAVDSRATIPRKTVNNKCILGWNKHVSLYHQQARYDYQMYILYGKPESGPIFEQMQLSRKIFKSRLKYCQGNQEQIRMDILASQHNAKHFSKFWNGTKKLNGKMSLPVSIDGVSDPTCIANVFRDQFRVEPIQPACSPVDAESIPVEQPISISSRDVADAIKNMKRGKSPGHDGLSIEHLQHAGPHVNRVLSLLFTSCVRHSFLPHDLMKTVVVPLVKNATGDTGDKNNYRPISLATVISKVLDRILDVHISPIALHEAQFGFRKGLSTESAILTLKYAVDYYLGRGTPVYACFLDLSKAFDLVSYDILWNKLRQAGVSSDVVDIFSFWYSNQRNVVKWSNAQSDEYSLKCGVRQGGLTSPRLFNLFVNDLIGGLSSMRVGCRIDNVSVNNISYADDMVLLSPSISGLRKLLKVCETYAVQHGLKYNEIKSEFLLFKGKNKEPVAVPPVFLNGTPLKRVAQFKYLGHIVTEDLKDEQDIERERRALSVRGNMLAHRFARCTVSVKLTLFRAYCQSFYTCALWTNFTLRTYNALRVQYNNAFRALLRLPRYCSASGMFADAGVEDFYAIMRKRSASVVRRLRGSSNGILKMIGDRMDGAVFGRFTDLHIRM